MEKQQRRSAPCAAQLYSDLANPELSELWRRHGVCSASSSDLLGALFLAFQLYLKLSCHPICFAAIWSMCCGETTLLIGEVEDFWRSATRSVLRSTLDERVCWPTASNFSCSNWI